MGKRGKDDLEMKRVDFSNGRIFQNILLSAIPLLVAQLLNLLYNIVDRIYIARIPSVGMDALGGIGLCFPLISLITGFTNLYGSGGSPLCSIELGCKNHPKAEKIMNTSAILLIATGFVITCLGWMFCSPILRLFGASDQMLTYAWPYMMIIFSGTIFSMFSVGMAPFINAQGFSYIGMLCVIAGALINIVLDPILIFVCHLGIQGAALATIIAQMISALIAFSFLKSKKASLKLDFKEIRQFSWDIARKIIGLGSAAFTMQLTNTLVQIAGNFKLSVYGGDLYISIRTVIASITQIMDTPVHAMSEGASPVLSYNYGARNGKGIRKGIWIMVAMGISYTAAAWATIMIHPAFFISIFSDDPSMINMAIPALQIYLFGYVFQSLQYAGQTVFKSLNRKKEAIFFSLFRKVFIGIPGMFIMPLLFTNKALGVFAAEPVSNVIGGFACFITMLIVIMPSLKKLDSSGLENRKSEYNV